MENGGAAGRTGNNNGASSWDFWELGIWSSSSSSPHVPSSSYAAAAAPSAATCFQFSDHQLVTGSNGNSWTPPYQQQQQRHRHHHLTCLKLGKRQYYGEDTVSAASAAATKRERPTAPATASATAAAAPRCQVDGCSKVLVEEKEYHKRHKVCELHSKTPKVLLLGVEQRFCQQCSRFHAISEFDDAKRSCRRRLAGHNERRRKNSTDSMPRNPVLESAMAGGVPPYASTGCALSLLSSKASPWISTSSDFSSRSSAALNELIAENRAAVLARQLFLDHGGGWHAVVPAKQQQHFPSASPHQTAVTPQAAVAHLGTDGWSAHLQDAGGRNVTTLDLLQMPSSSFDVVPRRSRSSKEEDEECNEIWKSLAGTHVV